MTATRLDFGTRTFVMGIINLTPDSFSGDGLLGDGELVTAALDQARRFVAAGADILDIGGESTRPGAQQVTVDEEIARIEPVMRALQPRPGCAALGRYLQSRCRRSGS